MRREGQPVHKRTSATYPSEVLFWNKSSAVTEMGDRLATIDIGQKVRGLLCPFHGGVQLSPHLTQCRLGQGLPLYQVVSWSTQPFGQNIHGPKGGCAVPLSVGGARSSSNNVTWAEAYPHTKWHLDPSNCLATIHQCYRQTGQSGQWSRSTGRTVTCNGRPKSGGKNQREPDNRGLSGKQPLKWRKRNVLWYSWHVALRLLIHKWK